jgi:hypothetical protein
MPEIVVKAYGDFSTAVRALAAMPLGVLYPGSCCRRFTSVGFCIGLGKRSVFTTTELPMLCSHYQ